MKTYGTIIRAVNWETGELCTFEGPKVPGINRKDAQRYCNKNDLGYCKVTDELVSEIPTIGETLIPDWGKEVNYQNIKNN